MKKAPSPKIASPTSKSDLHPWYQYIERFIINPATQIQNTTAITLLCIVHKSSKLQLAIMRFR